MPISRTQLTNILLKMQPAQINDLLLFEYFKKWTVSLFALAHAVNYSTAHRRLAKLMRTGALAVHEGSPKARGGSVPDLYYLTTLGARMITRLRDRHKNAVTMPDTSNPVDNVHDLAVLEVAIRSGCFDGARAFQERRFVWNSKPFSLIPDVEFISPDGEDRVFIEVEQTSRADHILHKYEQYARFFSTLPEHPYPWLVVVFPDERTTKLLLPEHERAAYHVADGEDYLWFYATLSDLSEKNALIYESKVEPKPGGGFNTVAWGFLDCTRGLLDY